MFSKWRRKREEKRIQKECPHEWHVVRGNYAGYTGFIETRLKTLQDVYCPICEMSVNGVISEVVTRELRKQDIRQEYFNKE